MQVIQELLKIINAAKERDQLSEAVAKPLPFWPSTSKRPVTVNSALRHHKDQEFSKLFRKQLSEAPTRKRLEDLLKTSDITKIFVIALDEDTAEAWKDASLVEVPLVDMTKYKLNNVQNFRKPIIVHTASRGKDNEPTELHLFKHKRCENAIKVQTVIGLTTVTLLFFTKPEEPAQALAEPDVPEAPAENDVALIKGKK